MSLSRFPLGGITRLRHTWWLRCHNLMTLVVCHTHKLNHTPTYNHQNCSLFELTCLFRAGKMKNWIKVLKRQSIHHDGIIIFNFGIWDCLTTFIAKNSASESIMQ